MMNNLQRQSILSFPYEPMLSLGGHMSLALWMQTSYTIIGMVNL